MPNSFGATDSLICPKCKKHLMSLTRRTPHRVRGHDFERQTFTCRVCQYEIARDADRMGEVAS
jgi:uncharacterized protein YbaR (Trm112 family)